MAGSLLLRPIADMVKGALTKGRGQEPSKSTQASQGGKSGSEAEQGSSQRASGQESSQRVSGQESSQRASGQESQQRASGQESQQRASGQDSKPYIRGVESAPRVGDVKHEVPDVPDVADERTMRRVLEAQYGGISSQESAERYARGENPGGTHHKAVRRDGPEHQRPEMEEPQERKQTVPGGEKHIPVTRKGS
jgi:hypothetical protein